MLWKIVKTREHIMTILNNYHHFEGLGWSTGYLCNVLAYQGVTAPHTGKPYTEAMLMGINGGICAGYFAFEYTGWDPHLHFLTRYPFDEQPGAVFERLGIAMHVQHTTNPQKGTANLINALAQGRPAIVWADVASFAFNNLPAGDDFRLVMPFVVYGFDMNGGVVNIADRAQVALTATADELATARARLAKTKQRIMTIDAPKADKLPAAVEAGIRACIQIFTEPPPFAPKAKGNFGFDAFTKWANLLTNTKDKRGWPQMFATGPRMYAGLTSAYRYLEVWFTGGHGARAEYANFLDEAAQILDNPGLNDVAPQFRTCAKLWDTLTNALLPDHVVIFEESRELMQRSYHQFLTQGNASLDERRQISARLDALKAEAARDFPLTDAEAAAMRETLRDHVLRLHDAEYAAISALAEVCGEKIPSAI
jgi:hypothetical protein